MLAVQNCFRKHGNFAKGLIHKQCCLRKYVLGMCPVRVCPVRMCSSSTTHGEFTEQFVRNVFLEQTNRDRLVRRLERFNSGVQNDENVKAAVLIPLCISDDKLSILITRRTPHLKTNPGQPSFPGGKVDAMDSSTAAAAIRECEEEIGTKAHDVEVWVSLPAVPDRLGKFTVHPVLGFIKDYNAEKLRVNKAEVQEIFTIPLTQLIHPSYHGYTLFRSGWTMPVFKASPTNVWGMTAIFIDILLANAFPRDYTLISKRREKN